MGLLKAVVCRTSLFSCRTNLCQLKQIEACSNDRCALVLTVSSEMLACCRVYPVNLQTHLLFLDPPLLPRVPPPQPPPELPIFPVRFNRLSRASVCVITELQSLSNASHRPGKITTIKRAVTLGAVASIAACWGCSAVRRTATCFTGPASRRSLAPEPDGEACGLLHPLPTLRHTARWGTEKLQRNPLRH